MSMGDELLRRQLGSGFGFGFDEENRDGESLSAGDQETVETVLVVDDCDDRTGTAA